MNAPVQIFQKEPHDNQRDSDIADAAIALCRHRHPTVAKGGFCSDCSHITIVVVEAMEGLGWADDERLKQAVT